MRNTFHTVAATHPARLRLPLRVVDQLTPALLCLNAKESAQIPPTPKDRTVLFVPELVNGTVSACTLERTRTAVGNYEFLGSPRMIDPPAGRHSTTKAGRSIATALPPLPYPCRSE